MRGRGTNSLSQPFHESDAESAPSRRTSSSVHSWLVDKWARKRGCSPRSQCTQETWTRDAGDRGKRSSLSPPEGTENSRCPQWVHRCSRQKRGSSDTKKRGGVKADWNTRHRPAAPQGWLSYNKEKVLLVLLRGQGLSFHQDSLHSDSMERA